MKWLKHLVDSGDDPDIRDAMTLYGEKAYYIFFRTLEIMSREFDEKNPGTSTFSLSYFSSRFYKCNWRSLAKVLDFYSKRNRFEIQFSENQHFKEITIKCPKLKELTDEYTQKRLKQMSGQNPDCVGTKSRIEEEVEEDKEYINNSVSVKKPKRIPLSDEEFISSLKEKFTWIDFDEAMIKMDAWLLAHPNRKKTRRFIVNWINKIEKPMENKHESW